MDVNSWISFSCLSAETGRWRENRRNCSRELLVLSWHLKYVPTACIIAGPEDGSISPMITLFIKISLQFLYSYWPVCNARNVVWVDSSLSSDNESQCFLWSPSVSSTPTTRPKCYFSTKEEPISRKYLVHIYAPDEINPLRLFPLHHKQRLPQYVHTVHYHRLTEETCHYGE